MAETSKPSRRRRSAAPVNRRTTSVTWGKHASGLMARSSALNTAILRQAPAWQCRPSPRCGAANAWWAQSSSTTERSAILAAGRLAAADSIRLGWHRYVPIAVAVAVIVIALAVLGYAGGGANLDAVFKSPELAHAGTEVVEGAQTQTGVAPQRGIVAAASTIADAQKDEDKQGDDAEAAQTSEATTTQIST